MDRISSLPNDVLCHILSFLPTKHAVATSVLCSRWVNLWAFLSIIDLDDSLYLNPPRKWTDPALFLDFVDRVLSLNHSQTIVKFRLHINDASMDSMPRINGFIHNVILRNVVEIDLGIYLFEMDEDCIKISHSQSLKVLKIRSDMGLKMPAFSGCFPSLRVFDVEVKHYESDDEWMKNLFPCLSVLEKLSLVVNLNYCAGKYYVNISGIALKRLELKLSMDDDDVSDAVVVIDAPHLEYLRLEDTFLASYVVKNKPAISQVGLDVGDLDEVGLTRLNRFNELLQGLVNAKFLSVSVSTSKFIFSQRWNLPVLPCLTKLELDVHTSSWILVLYWLESCPNLKVLTLIIKENPTEEYMVEELELNEPNHVPSFLSDRAPSCLSSHLKEIEVKRCMKVEEREMLEYLLYNAKVLDKFTINSHVYIKDGIRQ